MDGKDSDVLNREDQGNASSANASSISETKRGVVRWLIREVIGVVFVALTLFIPAGRLDWPMGWALVAIYAAWVTAQAVLIIPRCPELLAERAKRRQDFAGWDNAVLGVIGVLTLAKYIVAGLDQRFGWTPQMLAGVQIAALVVAALGYALLTWAMVSNAFFSVAYRIQDERGHRVATGGPYRYVRHPGYSGSVAFELATPIMLGSLWALVPGILTAILLVVRTALEDRELRSDLEGYDEFSQRVRYRLIPGVW
jgi:protein-S-isoprenylcysteine O-methyltransferase Ste14